ncbi:MAG: uracil phosphoribosyltransferase [Paludibacteraceae bacterium]|nr:uracil phosphoribosyltransferase [Paludibacteraceae bacterium]
MQVINLSEQNSVLLHFLRELRDVNVQGDSMRFRTNIARIGHVMAYEVSKRLHYSPIQITTPLAPMQVNQVDESVVLATVLRAGLPLHQGFLDVLDHAECAFLSAYRTMERDEHGEEQLKIVSEYMASPDLTGKTLLIVDPMLASGMSLDAAYQSLLRNGTPKHLHVCCVIAAPEGVAYLQEHLPQDATLWCAAIDHNLNEHKYIVPGLGDAGDLCFGDKL